MSNEVRQAQSGAALFTALIFLVIITLISLSAMRSTTLELRMARNEQAHMRAVQSAQSAIDGTLDTLRTYDFMQMKSVGTTLCINDYPSTCDITQNLDGVDYTISSDAFDVSTNAIEIELTNPAMPPPRSIQSSAAAFEAVLYSINSTFDDTDNGEGRAAISQGFLMLIPDSTN